MNETMVRGELCNGVFLSTITDPKFKSNRISCNLVLPLCEETATEYAVLPFILRKRFAGCPDFTRLNERLCELYGAVLDADVRKYGAYQILNVTIQTLDDRFTIGGEQVTAECARLACGLLLEPYFVDGAFDEQDFELERQSLIDTIESEINDKRDYALSKCQRLLFEQEPFAVKKYGTKERAQKLTAQSAAKAYHEAVRRAHVEILFIGCGDSAPAAEVFRTRFAALNREPIEFEEHPTSPAKSEVREETERLDVAQGKLVLGFRLDGGMDQDEANAAKLMCALFGGTPVSRLFRHVREELSLCYYCAARYDRATASILVDSGVEAANAQRAREEIQRQLEIVQRGEFEESEQQETILAVSNALKSTTDTLGGMEGWYFGQIMAQTNESPRENAEKIRGIGKDEIMRAANRVKLDTIYFLTGKEGGANE